MNTIKRVIVVAPHPDDEVLGLGGTLLRLKEEGAKIAWLVVTCMTTDSGCGEEKLKARANEIATVKSFFGFDSVYELNLPTAFLDQVPMSDLVGLISTAFKDFMPDEVYVPHRSDVHSDHRIVFDAAISCTKWFRHKTIKRVLAYETISETDFGLGATKSFTPNVFVGIEPYLEGKLQAMEIYTSELSAFPFPRSKEAICALATVRGASSGFMAAEAFELLKEIY